MYPTKSTPTFPENGSEKQESPGKINSRIWITKYLTYSFFLKTPLGVTYRLDGYEEYQEAYDARNALGKKIQGRGEGTWTNPKEYEPAHYSRPGPRSSEDSHLSQTVMMGSNRRELRPEMLPNLPGRVKELRPERYKT